MIYRLLVILTLLVVHVRAASGEGIEQWIDAQDVKGVIFRIKKARSILEKGNPEEETQNFDLTDHTGREPLTVLAVTLELVNKSKTRKINLTNEMPINLYDEYGNNYLQQLPPDNYSFPIQQFNAHYPSLYPQESFLKTLFFEPPLKKSHNFKIIIDPASINIPEKVVLLLKSNDIELPDNGLQQQDQFHPTDGDIIIIEPENGKMAKAGETVLLQIGFSAHTPRPDKIYLLSPTYVVEDPYLALRYDVRIPGHYQAGPFTLVVMASWIKDDDEYLLSKSITLEIE